MHFYFTFIFRSLPLTLLKKQYFEAVAGLFLVGAGSIIFDIGTIFEFHHWPAPQTWWRVYLKSNDGSRIEPQGARVLAKVCQNVRRVEKANLVKKIKMKGEVEWHIISCSVIAHMREGRGMVQHKKSKASSLTFSLIRMKETNYSFLQYAKACRHQEILWDS